MADQTDFLNDALGQIGATFIRNIDDGSPNAEYCAMFWPQLRKAIIRSNHWNFAVSRAALAQTATPPVFEFAYAYELPADLLKIITFNGSGQGTVPINQPGFIQLYPQVSRYVIEGRQLLTNDPQAYIVFLKDEENPDLWDALFYQVATAWLASKLATAITKSEKTATMKMQEVRAMLLPLAIAVDGQEGTELPESIDTLIRVR